MSFNPVTRKNRNLPKFGKLYNQNENNPPQRNAKKDGQAFEKVSKNIREKRKAEVETRSYSKRSAFGDITNAIEKTLNRSSKSSSKKLKDSTDDATLKKVTHIAVSDCPKDLSVIKTSVQECKRIQEKFISSSNLLLQCPEQVATDKPSANDFGNRLESCNDEEERQADNSIPDGVVNFDATVSNDLYAVSEYAMDVFNYYKDREDLFIVKKYLSAQPDINKSMRAILVDWMVEIQENFELNHETLYLAVKLVDLFLSKEMIKRDRLQLVGSTAIFLACKFDERVPPYIDDFLYICNDAYVRRELILMEIKILKALDFDLGIPLSYRFLRRYSRCSQTSMELLTFARYILESSLLEEEFVEVKGSIMACASLFLALRIKEGIKQWSATLRYYSGYQLDDFYHFVHSLHQMLMQPPKDHLKTIRNKYSHKIFFEVAKIPIPEKIDI